MTNSIILKNVTPDELTEKLRLIVREELGRLTPQQKKNEPVYKTRKEVKELLHISYPTLNELTKSGKLPAYRIGGRVLYREDEIQASLNQIVTSKFKKNKS